MARSTISPTVGAHTHNVIARYSDEILTNESGLAYGEVQMWCQRVEDFSSQYGNEVSISYTMSNLEGESSIYSQYGDFTQAAVMRTYGRWWKRCPSAATNFFRPRGAFISQDFVELSFEHSVVPTNIEVFETYNPGSVVRILACDKSGELPPRWHVLWEGLPQAPPKAARIFSPQTLRKCPFYTSRIRIEFHHSHLPYYAELDAVRLTGTLPEDVSRPTKSSGANRKQGPQFLPCFESESSESPAPSLNANGQNARHHDEEEEEEEQEGQGSSVDLPAERKKVPETGGDALSSADEGSASGAGSRLLLNQKDWESLNCAFFRLPMEILKIIFDYLDLKSLCNLHSTCRFFSQHCVNETQFYELDLQPYWHLITDKVLATMSRKFKRFRKVDLSWCSNISNHGFTSCLAEPRPLLTCLRLNCCHFVDCNALETIATQCPNLRELRLQSCQKVKGSSFACLASLKELRVLDLYRTLVDTDSLVKIARSCQKLEHLNVGSCTNNTDCNRVATELARSCPNLKSVDFWRSRGLGSVGLSALVRGCRHLEELDLGWCSQVKSKEGCFREIAEHCPNLRKLFVTANRGLCNADLDLLSLNCQRLEQLDVLGTREITNCSIKRLLDRCQALELLDLSFCAGVDYPGLEPALGARPRVDVKRSFQGSGQAEEYLDRPFQLQ